VIDDVPGAREKRRREQQEELERLGRSMAMLADALGRAEMKGQTQVAKRLRADLDDATTRHNELMKETYR